MEQSLELFDRHADEVFASFMEQGYSRAEALFATEHFFLRAAQGAGTAHLPKGKPYFAGYFGFGKRSMKVAS
jgi:hypothetical protein